MRKLIVLAGFLVFILGCDLFLNDQKASLRFQNNSDYVFFYGLKFGDAEYRGRIPPGFSSPFYDSPSGSYFVKTLNEEGNWLTVSGESLTMTGGNYYTLIYGGFSGAYYWSLVLDD